MNRIKGYYHKAAAPAVTAAALGGKVRVSKVTAVVPMQVSQPSVATVPPAAPAASKPRLLHCGTITKRAVERTSGSSAIIWKI